MHLKRHLFSYSLVILLVFLAAASYFRFMVQNDYLVTYEGDCNPYTQDCFLYCEDDECSDPFYYSSMERHAAELYALCGKDITDCDMAYECQNGVEICSITFCDLELDGDSCETLTNNDFIEDSNEFEL